MPSSSGQSDGSWTSAHASTGAWDLGEAVTKASLPDHQPRSGQGLQTSQPLCPLTLWDKSQENAHSGARLGLAAVLASVQTPELGLEITNRRVD